MKSINFVGKVEQDGKGLKLRTGFLSLISLGANFTNNCASKFWVSLFKYTYGRKNLLILSLNLLLYHVAVYKISFSTIAL